MLEMMILGLLTESPSYGYEIKIKLTDLSGYYKKISDGTLYPALKRLIEKGYVLENPTGDSRSKNVLTITPEGKVHLVQLLRTPSDKDISDRNKFYGFLNFIHLTSKASQLDLLQKRLAFIQTPKPFHDKDSEKTLFRDGMLYLAKQTRSAELAWLRETIEALKSCQV